MNVDATSELPNILKKVASSATSLATSAVTSAATTATTNQHDQQQLIHMVHSLYGAIIISSNFFKTMFSFLLTLIKTTCSPFIWITTQLWSNFVSKPFDLFMHVIHLLYPVILFCIAAIGCGLFIGGCAGFAAEACSSLLISATWGPQPKQIKEEEEEEELEEEGASVAEHQQEENTIEEPPMLKSRASSIWESSSSFFGVQPQKSTKSMEKEPLVQPQVELWRDSVSPPVLIRRKKLSSTKDDWGWDEDENDLSYTRPTSSSSSMYKNK